MTARAPIPAKANAPEAIPTPIPAFAPVLSPPLGSLLADVDDVGVDVVEVAELVCDIAGGVEVKVAEVVCEAVLVVLAVLDMVSKNFNVATVVLPPAYEAGPASKTRSFSSQQFGSAKPEVSVQQKVV